MKWLGRLGVLGLILQFAGQSTAPAQDAGSATTATNAPRIGILESNFDFGKVKHTDIVTHDFIITNSGTAVLEILTVQPECGCTIAGAYDRRIEPGKTGKIPIQFKPGGFSGHASRGVKVTCNDPAQAVHRLQFQAFVWRPFLIEPTMLTFVSAEGEEATKVVRIINQMEEAVTLEAPVSTNDAFKTELKTVQPGKEFELRVTWSGTISNFNFGANFVLKTSATNIPTVVVAVRAKPLPALAVQPHQIQLPSSPWSGVYEQTLKIHNNGQQPVKLSEAFVNSKDVIVQLQETEPGKNFSVRVEFPSDFQSRSNETAALIIKTTNPGLPVLIVPVVQAALVSALKPAAPVTKSK